MERSGTLRRWGLILGLTSTLGGCSLGTSKTKTASAPPFQGVKLVVGAVGDTAILPVVAAQRGEWQATKGGAITVRQEAVEPSRTEGIDVFLFPGDRLGGLVDHQALAVLPESVVQPAPPETEEEATGTSASRREEKTAPADPLQFGDVAMAYRDQVTKYGSDRMALPIGGSALVLVMNRSAFEREANRESAQKEGLTLEPPTTWEEFDQLARFFQGRDWNGDGTPDFGVALAPGQDPEGLGEATFLARAASLGQHRDQYSFLFDADSMVPRITTPPFVETLRDLAALKECGPPDMPAFDAEAARRAFEQGNVAMLIDRAERAGSWGHGKAIGVAPLPGSKRVYDPARKVWETDARANHPSYLPFGGGWLVGVSRRLTGPQREAAIDFARYLISPETASRIRGDRAFPMIPVRTSLLVQGFADPRAAPGVSVRQWSDAVGRTLGAARVVPSLRIPQANDYLADLGKARQAVLQGESPERALENVAELWSKRTEELGKDRQLWHYRRSLNALATLPEPPDH
jgi:multiple sugar transport system substrate-binding protein